MISLRCNLSYLDTIRQKLGNLNMSAIKASCFGHLFSISDLGFQGQLYNMLLRRLVNGSQNDQTLSFNMNGCTIDFRPSDFGIIIGLKFGSPCNLPAESEIYRVVFGSKCSITVDEIEKELKAECRANTGCSQLSLKLTFLLIVFRVLLVCGSSQKNVDMAYLHLADDIQMFQLFPWGGVTYDLLVRQTQCAKAALEKVLYTDKKIKLESNGFPFALQVWTYEVNPVVARNCAQKIEGAGNCFPRILRWIATKTIKFDIVHTYFRNVKPEHLMPIFPNDFEKQLLHELGVNEMSAPRLMPSQEAQLMECGGLEALVSDVVEEAVVASVVGASRPKPNITIVDPVNDPVVASLCRRVAQLEQVIRDMNTSRSSESDSERKKRRGLRTRSSPPHNELKCPPVKPHTSKRPKKVSHVQGIRRSNTRMPQLRKPHLLCSPNPYDPNETVFLADQILAYEN